MIQKRIDFEKKDINIIRVGKEDAVARTDNFYMLRSKILTCEEMYPGIQKWIDNKVINGLKTGERIAYVGLIDDKPVVTAVVKKGRDSKFCHLKIDKTAQDRGWGDIFFSLMTLEVRNSASSVHFTLPESLWESKKEFFKSFSFDDVVKCNQQYRLFEEELRSETSYLDVYKRVLSKLTRFNGIASISGFSMDSQLVLSIQPKYAENIMLGMKSVEIRKKFSKDWEGARFNVYASAPIKSLLGEVRIERVIEGTPAKIWELFGKQIGESKEEYDRYADESDNVCALVLGDIRPYTYPVPLVQIEYLLGTNLVAPQSYGVVGNNANWMTAISLAAILQGHTRSKKPIVTKVA